jgi:hypothetical protein
VTEPAWKRQLEAAREPLTPEQARWDSEWQRWLVIARRTRSLNQAIPIAWTRTKSQYGLRPGTPEENQV